VGRLIYSAITSLDGCVEDSGGKFDWSMPDEDVFRFVNNLERSIGTYLYGRRMYEVMLYWEGSPVEGSTPDLDGEFRKLWHAANKVVFSRTLKTAPSAKTRIQPKFEPEAVRRLKASSSHDLTIAGANLAGQAIEAGLVDEIQQFVAPVIVGGGKQWLPRSVHIKLELLECTRFSGGFVFLRYRPSPDGTGVSR
jgi:dihydrofolate reductase